MDSHHTPNVSAANPPLSLALYAPRLLLWWRALAILWTILIVLSCWLPAFVVQKIEGQGSLFSIPDLDKAIHFIIFYAFALFWLRTNPHSSPVRSVAILIAGASLAIVTEIVQGLPIVGRDTSMGDIAADIAGVIACLATARFLEPIVHFVEVRVLRLLDPGAPSQADLVHNPARS